MKKLLSFVFVALMFACGISFVQPISTTSAEEQIDWSMRVYGDSMTAGYGLSDYDPNNTSYLPQFSFPNQINTKVSQFLNTQIKNYAISGDTSTDLVEILEPYTNGTAEDMADFVATDHFIVCIGANNVLGPATSQMINYIISSIDSTPIKNALATYISGYTEITEEQYRAILSQSLQTFKNDFENIILPTFQKATNAQINIMTVYNPYKHTSLNNIDAGSLASFVPYLESGFQEMLSITMEYLNGTSSIYGINQIIRDNASQNIKVVDIWNLFDTFCNQQYKQYINSDETKIKITSIGDLKKETFTSACDPHPTKDGHQVIANAYLENFNHFSCELSDTSFNPKTTEDAYEINVKRFSYGESEETFKLIAQIGSNTYQTTLAPTNNTLLVSASDLYELVGQKTNGEFYVQYIGKNSKISNTEKVSFDLTNYDIQATLSSSTNFGDITKKTDSIRLNVSVEGNLTYTKYELYHNNGQNASLVGTFATNNINITANDIPKTGELFVKVYSGIDLVATSNSLEYSFSLALVATLSAPNGMNVTTPTDSISLLVEMSVPGNYKYELYRNGTLFVGAFNSPQITIFGQDIANLTSRSGRLCVKVYDQANQLVATSNELEYNLLFNYTISLSSSADFSITHRADDLIRIELRPNYYSLDIIYRVYNKHSTSLYHIGDFPDTVIDLRASQLINGASQTTSPGELYVEVYENNSYVVTSNSFYYTLLYEFVNPTVSFITNQQQITSPNDDVEILVSTAYNYNSSNINYLVEVFINADERIHSQSLWSTSQTISLKAGSLGTSGIVYVRVYYVKGFETSQSVNFEFDFQQTTATLVLLTPVNQVVSYDSIITLEASTSVQGNYEYKYIINSDYPVANNNITTSLATYQTNAAALRKSGSVYCEVYQNNTLVCTTNTVEYNFEYLKEYVVQISIANQQSITDLNSLVYIQISMQIPNDNYTFKLYCTDLAMVEGDELVASTESVGIWVAVSMLGKSGTLSCEIYKDDIWLSQDSESLCEYNFVNLNIPNSDDDNDNNNNTGSDSNSGNGEQNPNNTSNDETAKTIILIAFFVVIATGAVIAFVVVFMSIKKRL
ncbi:MAG: SGNH/GDSL hydrolase family protein [Clostridia bacterium]|nr:SGNH/GDSL hydrolase family protein [Clostridia bacterium]